MAIFMDRNLGYAPKIDHPVRCASISSACEPSSELPFSFKPGDHTAMRSLAGRHDQDAAADAALARQADAVGEVTRPVIVAAGQHQGVDAPGTAARDHGASRRRIAPAGSEEQTGARELPARHGKRAVVEIDAEHMVGRMIELAEGAHELGKREIAETCVRLRAGDALVDDDGIVASQKADELHDLADHLLRLVPGQQHVGHGDGAGVDEGIAWLSLLALQLDDRVERSA